MLRFAADEDFDQRIVDGLRRRLPELDVLRVQEAGLEGADDPEVLEWAAREGRVLLTHDVSTMSRYAWARVTAGQPMPGVFEVPQRLPVGHAIEDLVLLTTATVPEEWEGQVRYLPLAAGG